MKVFKFGGASINSVERIKNVANIINNRKNEGLLVIISAMGKTTNALEAVAEAFFAGKREEALQLFEEVKQQHNDTLAQLTVKNPAQAQAKLLDFYTEVEWLLHDKPVREYDYYYDQLVCIGELLSTTIVFFYLQETGAGAKWFDVRDIVRTDDNFRDAAIDWQITSNNVHETILPAIEPNKVLITQGFIGATDENESTTLGREGSDYSAAIFANILGAESVTIWKDVDAVMNADPKTYANAIKIDYLSFAEVIEMAYYGAQVIHPKTIKPLQNKSIPLLVKSFLDPELKGTVIGGDAVKQLPPIIVNKKNQVLVSFTSKDFSFVGGKTLESLYELFIRNRIIPGLSQNTAISLMCVFDDIADRIEALALDASANFDVVLERGLSMLTIRHYNQAIIGEMTAGKLIVLLQKTPETYQAVVR